MSFVKITKEFLMLVKGDLDQYTTQKSTIKVNNFKSLSLFTPAHLQFARYGRGPGKMPPLDPLIEWVSKKGIVSGGPSEARGAAFAIAKSISKKGTKNYVPNAPNALEEALDKHMNTYVTKVNEKHVNDTVRKLEKSYNKELKGFTISI
tara:strand:+ start:574 stop:1020 length:447 start_codon:yes stop_codon:yes gene_type:complete